MLSLVMRMKMTRRKRRKKKGRKRRGKKKWITTNFSDF